MQKYRRAFLFIPTSALAFNYFFETIGYTLFLMRPI